MYISHPYVVHIHEVYHSKRLGNKERSYLFLRVIFQYFSLALQWVCITFVIREKYILMFCLTRCRLCNCFNFKVCLSRSVHVMKWWVGINTNGNKTNTNSSIPQNKLVWVFCLHNCHGTLSCLIKMQSFQKHGWILYTVLLFM